MGAARRQNHWLDALYNACAAAHGCGARLVREQDDVPPPPAAAATPTIDPAAWLHRPPRW